MTVRVRETDNGYKALFARLEGAAGSVTVGIHEAEGAQEAEEGDGLTVLDVAAINEYGGPENNPPQRSFLGAWSDETEAENRERLQRGMEAVVAGKLPSAEVMLDRFGFDRVASVQDRIRAHIPPENAPSTIERKGSSTPLINHSQLLTSITHQVNK